MSHHFSQSTAKADPTPFPTAHCIANGLMLAIVIAFTLLQIKLMFR